MNAPLPVLIRPLTPADLPAYKQLRDEALRTAPEAFTSDYATDVHKTALSYAQRLGDPAKGHFLLGALGTDSRLFGAIGCERDTRLHKRHCATVAGMMVAATAQGRGIATQLIASCVEMAIASGQLEQLTLTVTGSNTLAVRLYERAGFVRYGLLPRAIQVDGTYYDKLHMVLLLPT